MIHLKQTCLRLWMTTTALNHRSVVQSYAQQHISEPGLDPLGFSVHPGRPSFHLGSHVPWSKRFRPGRVKKLNCGPGLGPGPPGSRSFNSITAQQRPPVSAGAIPSSTPSAAGDSEPWHAFACFYVSLEIFQTNLFLFSIYLIIFSPSLYVIIL